MLIINTQRMMMIMITRRIMIGPLLIRSARTHESPVRTRRTHGPDGEKALHNKLFRASGPGDRCALAVSLKIRPVRTELYF